MDKKTDDDSTTDPMYGRVHLSKTVDDLLEDVRKNRRDIENMKTTILMGLMDHVLLQGQQLITCLFVSTPFGIEGFDL